MKKITLITKALACCVLLMAVGLNSCIEETFPESSTATKDQVMKSKSAMEALQNSIVGYINEYNSYDRDLNYYNAYNFDFGYPAWGIMRDVMCEDFYIYSSDYDYFPEYGLCTSLGVNNTMSYVLYGYYFKLLKRANDLVGLIDKETTDPLLKQYAGVAHTCRALAYLDMARLYEYKKTGIAKLDNEAAANKVYGLTTQLVTEKTSETDARNNPRVPFQTMYKYILDELETAGNLLNGFTRSAKNLPNSAVVAGLKARTWLELGSRFEKYPADLAAFTAVRSDITSAKDCYAKAAQFAREAITASGAQPLTESDWFGGKSYTTGFNSILASSWMWGIITKEANVYSSYINFASNMCPEQTFGVANATYGATRTISKALFDQIPDADWRKASWIAPGDAGKAPGSKYRTLLTDDDFKTLAPYAGLKFKPNEGNMIDYKVGAAMDYPLMRVEEMYFIEAEALAASQGVAAGVSALESFMKTYRYDSYKCSATTLADFRKELMLQKRIEFWGEGIIFWDYKRLELKVTRGYKDTNCPVGYRMNSIEGYCAPWFNIYFNKYETDQNKAIILNPDPSGVISDWTGQ